MELNKPRAMWQLMRMDRPIGNLLLLWPTLWALFIAAKGWPDGDIAAVFILGVVLMRSAGCVINDFADRHFDGHVKRTLNRPLPAGKVSSREALVLFGILVIAAFCLVMTLNALTIQLSMVALLLATAYPFMKRYTHFPQVVLGMAFGWAIPMAFAAQTGTVPVVAWALFVANVLWTVAYDTQYAMVDRDDDLKIGIKSTAVLFGRFDKRIVALLQLCTVLILIGIGEWLALGAVYFWFLLAAACLFVYQQFLIRRRDRDDCFRAFLNNNYVGLVVFLGIASSLLLK